ncbi:hypothetical protein BXZ70DRAFT_926974 [Cristinia sonorae]|uniref:Uncharacterized protein n=1 Tax=Cristinia sonorae TaxID=1940300 RepID=A0A8K0UT78_9AGAR|nr:hypothetical protein BXZ70DRAFT_926974 [Cristinia sonorae]
MSLLCLMANPDPGSYELQQLPNLQATPATRSSPLESPNRAASPHEQTQLLLALQNPNPEGKSVSTPSLDDNHGTQQVSTSSDNNVNSAPKKSVIEKYLQVFEVAQHYILPFIAIAYLAFCYAAHATVIQLKTRLVDDSPGNIDAIKSGVTSINIILITLGLYPVQTILTDLKSEEFFRSVTSKMSGVPLKSINSISNPSFGAIQSLFVIFRQHCSYYFFAAFLSGWLIFATSTLAPAALSVSTALVDIESVTLPIGAIGRDTIFNMSMEPLGVQQSIQNDILPTASSLAWAETQLNVTYSFTVSNGVRYIVPPPLNLARDVPSRWASDVAILDPKCEWGEAKLEAFGKSGSLEVALDVSFSEQNISATVGSQDIFFDDLTLQPVISYLQLHSLPQKGFLTSGAMMWTLAQCVQNCHGSFNANVNLTGITTLRLTDKEQPPIQGPFPGMPNQTFPPLTSDIAFLICSPNAVYETREVRHDGHGVLTVTNTTVSARQGNLDPTQTNIMLTNALQLIKYNAGPPAGMQQLGAAAQAALFFGQDVLAFPMRPPFPNASSAPTITPLPLTNITDTYARLLTAASKAFLNRNTNDTTANVPAHLLAQRIIFTTSLPQIVISTFLFLLLCAVHAMSRLRRDAPQFSLVNLAAGLDRSGLPREVGMARSEIKGKTSKEIEEAVIARIGDSCVAAGEDASGTVVLQLR